MLERAEENVNEAPQKQIDYILNNTEIKLNNKTKNVEPLITTQLLEINETLNGDVTKEYAATLVADSELIDDNQYGISPLSNYTRTDSEKSKGKDVKLTITIYYTTGTYNKVNYIRITKVKAVSKLIDTSCKIPYTKVRGGYRGFNLATNKWTDVTSAWTKSSGFTATRSINGAKLECTSGGILYSIWAESYCQIKRGTQTWSFSMKIYEADAGFWM